MLPDRWATASVHHCPRFSIKEIIVPPRAHTPRPLIACCCPHRAGSRAPSFSTEQPSEAVGAGGEGALQESWEGRPAPRPAPPQEQPHGAYHPAGGPALAPGGRLFLGGALRGPVEWVGQLTGPEPDLTGQAALQCPPHFSEGPGAHGQREGGRSESSTWPTARAATGLTVLLPGHLPSARTAQTSLLAPSAPWRPNWEFSLCCAKAVRGARQGLPLTCHRDRSDLFILV